MDFKWVIIKCIYRNEAEGVMGVIPQKVCIAIFYKAQSDMHARAVFQKLYTVWFFNYQTLDLEHKFHKLFKIGQHNT